MLRSEWCKLSQVLLSRFIQIPSTLYQNTLNIIQAADLECHQEREKQANQEPVTQSQELQDGYLLELEVFHELLHYFTTFVAVTAVDLG